LKILIYGINYSPELTGVGKYTGEMASWMAKKGNQVKVITAPPYYPSWSVGEGYSSKKYMREFIEGVEVLRCPLYIPANPKTSTRILHLISFSLTSLVGIFRFLLWKPEVVIVIEPSFFCTPGALLFSKLVGAKSVLHIQDFELDAMFGLGMMSRGGISKIAFKIESWVLRRFDLVSTISHKMLELLQSKGVQKNKTLFFPNWVDVSKISPNADGKLLRQKWGINQNEKVVLYSGNIGKKQGLELIVDAAEVLKSESHFVFVVVGQGAHRSYLEQLVKKKELNNIKFQDLVPYEQLSELMALADIHLVIQKKGAADIVLPSKLTTILSAGGYSIITAESDTELGLLIENNPSIAYRVEPENLPDLIKALKLVLYTNTQSVNQVARKYAELYLDKHEVLNMFCNEIDKLSTDAMK